MSDSGEKLAGHSPARKVGGRRTSNADHRPAAEGSTVQTNVTS